LPSAMQRGPRIVVDAGSAEVSEGLIACRGAMACGSVSGNDYQVAKRNGQASRRSSTSSAQVCANLLPVPTARAAPTGHLQEILCSSRTAGSNTSFGPSCHRLLGDRAALVDVLADSAAFQAQVVAVGSAGVWTGHRWPRRRSGAAAVGLKGPDHRYTLCLQGCIWKHLPDGWRAYCSPL